MGAVQSVISNFLPKPKEEFPLTGVQRIDDLITNAKEVVGMVTKPLQMVNEFKYRSFDLTPPAEATGLIDQAKDLIEAPKTIIEQNTKLFQEIPAAVKNPEKLLADPLNFVENIKRMIGDPMKVIEEYKALIGRYIQLGESSGDIIGLAQKYAEDYKKLITDDFQKIVDYLKELPGIVPIIQQSVEKLGTLESDLRNELTNFSGGVCQAAKSAHLVNHNIMSVNKYKKKYDEEITTAKRVVEQALEKTKEVEALIDQAKGYQAQAEEIKMKVEGVKDEVLGMKNKAEEIMQKVEDLKNKQEDFKNLTADPMKALDQAKGGLMDGIGRIKGFF